jgi:prevent-host-death family protein
LKIFTAEEWRSPGGGCPPAIELAFSYRHYAHDRSARLNVFWKSATSMSQDAPKDEFYRQENAHTRAVPDSFTDSICWVDLVHIYDYISLMTVVNVHDAKTNFSRLLERAHVGEEIILAKAGVPWARLLPLELPAERVPGRYLESLDPAFFEKLPDDELQAWER